MHLSFLIFMITMVTVAFLGIACSKTTSTTGNTPSITRKGIRSLSREQLRQKLQKLEAAKSPEPKMGAMCYEMAAPPERAEYVCPRCAEKTLYSNNDAQFIAWELDASRREFDLLKKETDLAVTLDEASFCSHCSPSAKTQGLILTITYADGTTHTDAPVTAHDLILLRDFLKGKLEYKTSNDGTSPLKEELPRLRELLGIDE